MNDIVNVALCEGRHAMPNGVEGSIFPNAVDPTDLVSLDLIAEMFVNNNLGKQINIYVTGLSVALVAVIKAARGKNVGLSLFHYNRDTGNYYKQTVQ